LRYSKGTRKHELELALGGVNFCDIYDRDLAPFGVARFVPPTTALCLLAKPFVESVLASLTVWSDRIVATPWVVASKAFIACPFVPIHAELLLAMAIVLIRIKPAARSAYSRCHSVSPVAHLRAVR